VKDSPFILNGIIENHLDKHIDVEPETVEKVKDFLYVEDLCSGMRMALEVLSTCITNQMAKKMRK